jgi:hypothetical protein
LRAYGGALVEVETGSEPHQRGKELLRAHKSAPPCHGYFADAGAVR